MTGTASGTPVRPFVRAARYILVAVAFTYTAGALIQVFLAGLSLFESAEFWSDHAWLGGMLGLLAYTMPLVALVGRAGRSTTLLALVIAVLHGMQHVFATIDIGYIGALHAVNAFALVGISSQVGMRASAVCSTGDDAPD